MESLLSGNTEVTSAQRSRSRKVNPMENMLAALFINWILLSSKAHEKTWPQFGPCDWKKLLQKWMFLLDKCMRIVRKQ